MKIFALKSLCQLLIEDDINLIYNFLKFTQMIKLEIIIVLNLNTSLFTKK